MDERSSMLSSTDDLLSPKATGEEDEIHQEPSLWYSAPLLCAIVPAIGGIVFKKGSVLVTDLALLVLAAVYLNWCLVTPWVWYEGARTIRIADTPSPTPGPATYGDESDGKHTTDDDDMEGAGDEKNDHHEKAMELERQYVARQELQIHEVLALALCFLGPVLGAYVLHVIRARLSHSVDELVSNLHLSLFVLGAELRPLRHLLKMVQKRTLHLQKVVREDPHATEKVDDATLKEVEGRLNNMEIEIRAIKAANQPTVPSSAFTNSIESLKKSQGTLQSQIDALNRAVRRYEKRVTAQSIQTDARLNGLEERLQDALSLAAAAASHSQKPGIVLALLQWISQSLRLFLEAARAAALYPVSLATELLLWMLAILLRLVRPVKRKSPHQKLATPRRASKDRPIPRGPRT